MRGAKPCGSGRTFDTVAEERSVAAAEGVPVSRRCGESRAPGAQKDENPISLLLLPTALKEAVHLRLVLVTCEFISQPCGKYVCGLLPRTIKTSSEFLQRAVLMTGWEGERPTNEIAQLIQLDGLQGERRIWKTRPSGCR